MCRAAFDANEDEGYRESSAASPANQSQDGQFHLGMGQNGCGSKKWYQNGTLVNGTKD